MILTHVELDASLEEDSEDFSEQEAATAEDTDSSSDFFRGVVAFAQGVLPDYQLRRRAGVFYARVLVREDTRVFRLNWLTQEGEV